MAKEQDMTDQQSTDGYLGIGRGEPAMKIRIVLRFLAIMVLLILGLGAQAEIGHVRAANQGASPCPPGCITEYALPPVTGNQSGAAEPFGITAASDGLVWFSHGDTIGRITPGGAVKEYPVPTQGSGTGWMHLGPDRAVWFAERNGNKIGHVAVNGRVTEYVIPSTPTSPTCPGATSTVPQGIATGSDGAIWFTEECGNRIGRIAADGQIIEYPVPTPDSHPLGITAGSDGALWFVEKAKAKIGRVTADGRITEFPISAGSNPQRITAGADGALWFSELRANKIGRLTIGGSYTEYAAPGGPVGITTGPDGALWFVEFNGNKIARMNTAGQVTDEYPIPTPKSGALQITVGPDAALWITETGVNQLGRLQIPGVHGRGQVMASSGPGVTASFTVSFSNTLPGQGEVYFGSGPGCLGLVEVATEDQHPGSTQHSVVVTGNDLPGTVGDIGIQAGATYWFEAVTLTSAGQEIDNNGGNCYSVTIPGA
jgi:virginiamycin B lyase